MRGAHDAVLHARVGAKDEGPAPLREPALPHLREALNAFFDVLMRHSIADLVAERPNMRGLLGIELPAQPQALAG